jgi:RNA polymerase sigma-70 factor (ECF subfamily)
MNVVAESTAAVDVLVAQARAGDEAAFTALVATYHEELLRVAFVITGDADVASDAAQHAWQIAWRKLGRLREPERVRSWLVAIAANEARQLARSRRRRSVMEIAVVPEADRVADPGATIGRLDLVNALARLKAEDRELLAMRFVAGFDSFEIAAARGVSASGTRARIARVLAQLRKELDRD